MIGDGAILACSAARWHPQIAAASPICAIRLATEQAGAFGLLTQRARGFMEEIVRAITVVTPCFNEELNVQECYEAVRNLFANELAAYRREHIFCDNASTDGTLAILRKIAAADASVKIIVNRRNFGPLKNTYNGVMASSGNAVLLFLPADLQDPPDLLPQFVKYWEEGYEIVYGIRATREEGWLMRSLRNAYYRVLTRFSEVKVPPGVGDFQLVDRRVVEAMREVRDGFPFLRMMTFECGGRAIGVPYTWRARKRGLSKNRFSALIDQAINGLVSFTSAPLRFGLMVGFFLSVLSIGYAIFNLVLGLVLYRKIAEPGIITIIVALFFFGGVQLFFMGMIGEYILAIHGQVRTKPVVFERERINFETPDRPVQEAPPVGTADPATSSR
jgi:glycosyltransferase involved in cell wall biosynthesis